MAAGVRDINRRRMPGAAVAAHAPRGIGLFDLVGFKRARLVRDTLLGVALIPVSLVFILGGTYAVGWLVLETSRRRTSWDACHCRLLSMACWCGRSFGG